VLKVCKFQFSPIHPPLGDFHARAESVRIPSFLRDLLAKSAVLTREKACNGSRPYIYIYIYIYIYM
jgi:hypothetical protein